jgi:hypothetical protein
MSESQNLNSTKVEASEVKIAKSVKAEKTTTNNDNVKYAVLMETSGEECESWYYCIKYQGNEKNLVHLQKQLEKVDWYILDDLSTFDLDLDHFISSQTAKELTKLELNSHSFHRKFDGVLDRIDLNLKRKDKNERKMVKVFDILGYGQIEDYIDGEDIDEEDLTDNPDFSSSEDSDNYTREKKNSKIPSSFQKIRKKKNRSMNK